MKNPKHQTPPQQNRVYFNQNH